MRDLWVGLRRTTWRLLAPIHRPLVRRFDAHMNGLLDERLTAELDARLVPTLSAALATTAQTVNRLDSLIARTNESTQQTDHVLNTLLEEVIRLREQVELLHRLVPQSVCDGDGHEHPSGTLSLVGREEDDGEPFDDEAEGVGRVSDFGVRRVE